MCVCLNSCTNTHPIKIVNSINLNKGCSYALMHAPLDAWHPLELPTSKSLATKDQRALNSASLAAFAHTRRSLIKDLLIRSFKIFPRYTLHTLRRIPNLKHAEHRNFVRRPRANPESRDQCQTNLRCAEVENC